MTKKKKNSLLWQISGKEMKDPSYFFGTMHVRDNRAFRGIDFLKSCIENCDSFAAEFDLQDADQRQLQAAARIQDGQSLEDLLNPRVYKKLDKLLVRETGHSLDNFKYSSPILLLNVLSEAQFQSENTMALDSTLYSIAQEADKKLLGLETFQAQISVFGKVSLKEQCRSLRNIATNFKSFKREIKKTCELYITGDIQKLAKKTKRSIGSMRRVLLYDRNITMADNFEIFSAENSLFAAVGAGHLGGQKGVLRLLKKKGYTIKPVFY
jgi:uncharacterized protein YbaP (TraB family)